MTLAPHVLKGKRTFASLTAQTATLTKTLSADSPSARTAYATMSLTKQGNMTISGGGYVTAMRGEANVASGVTMKDGFIYGAQGKAIVRGTLSQTSALRICGVQAALDCGSATVTAGQACALWADVAGADPTSSWDAETFVIRATNSTGKPVQAMMFTYGYANVMFDLNCATAGVVAAAGANSAGKSDGSVPADRVIKITLNGVTGYIPVFNGNT